MVLQRVAGDFYPSPSKLVEVWFKDYNGRPYFDDTDTFLECCDGESAISDVFRAHGYTVKATDIQDGREYDATTDEYWEDRCPDWVVTNPPFNQATTIITKALEACNKGVIMILRASYLEPCKDRRHLLDNRIGYVSHVNPKPKFRADTRGTDSSTVVFIVWEKWKREPSQQITFLTDWNR